MPTLTAMTWYYRLFGEEFGPVPHEMLVTLLENGTLSHTDEVRAETGSHWLTLKEVLDAPQDQTLESAGRATLDGLGDAQSGWYCKVLGRELGPMGFDEIQSFVEEGQLGPEAEVKLGAAGKWRAVRSIGRLMAVLPFEKGEHKIPEGRLSKEMQAFPGNEPSSSRESARPAPKSRIRDEFDDDEDDDDRSFDARRSRRKKKNRRGSDSQGYTGNTPPFGMPAFYPGGPAVNGYAGFPAAPTPAYGMPVAGAGFVPQWPQAAAPAPVDHLWYAWIGGQEYGPVDYSQLTQWATAGQLAATDYVRQGQAGQYVLASTINGLMPPPAPPVISAPVAPAIATPQPAVAATTSSTAASSATASTTTAKTSAKPADSAANAVIPAASVEAKAAVVKETPVVKASEPEPEVTKKATSESSNSNSNSSSYSSSAAASSYSSGASYNSGASSYSSGFGGAAPSRPMPARPAPKKKVAAERPEWLDDAIEGLKSPKALVAVGLLALVGIYFSLGFLPASTGSDRQLQTRLEEVLATVKKLRETKAPAGEWEALAQATAKEYPKDFVDKLQSSASRKYPYKQLHLWCVRDRLQKMISNSRTKVSHEERDFENNLREAAKLLGMPSTIPAAPAVAEAGGKPPSGAQ